MDAQGEYFKDNPSQYDVDVKVCSQ